MLDVAVRWRSGGFDLDVAFSSGAGVTAVFGPSGAGKSTLLNLIAGLARPAAGRIVVGGEPLFDGAAGIHVPTHKRRVGYVFQDARLFPHLSVRRNLRFGVPAGGGRHVSSSEERVVGMLDLDPLLDRKPATLSGGEAQRVALGRALLAAPRLLLMDEPLASLDGRRRAEILPYLEKLRDETDLGIVYVSHTVEEVTRLADQVLFLDHGRLVAAGPVADVMGRPDLMSLAGRGGAGAVLSARVVAQDASSGLATVGVGDVQLVTPDGGHAPGTWVRLRVRARDVALSLSPPTDGSVDNAVPATVEQVDHVEPAVATVRLAIGGQSVHAQISGRALQRLNLAPGGRVYALIDAVALDPPTLDPTQAPAAA